MATSELFLANTGMVSVAIPTYNRRVDLDKCLSTVLEQSYENKEIIVVDDGSKDDTVECVKKKYPAVRLIVNGENRGLNYCRNLGVLYGRGEYLLFLDSDVELTNKDQIKNMVKTAGEIPALGALGAYYYDETDPRVRACNLSNEVVFSLKNKEALQECDFVAGCNMFIRKKLIYENGGFDEFIKGDSTEVEMGLKLRDKGYRNLFGPSVALKHTLSPVERNNLGVKLKSARERWVWGRRNQIRYFIKNRGVRSVAAVFSVYFAEDVIAILAFVKQQFLGLKTPDSQNFPNLGEKFRHFFFLVRRMFDPFAWNVVHLRETLECRHINFLENKDNPEEIVECSMG